jgi:hypothetical protein
MVVPRYPAAPAVNDAAGSRRGWALSYWKNKSVDELIESLVGTAQPGSPVHEQIKTAVIVKAMDQGARRAVIATWIAAVSAMAAIATAIAAFAV